MNVVDINKTTKEILLARAVEYAGVEYKKSSNFKDKILKTVCAFANNIMRNEINFLFVGVSEDSSELGGVISHIPISGIKDAQLESIENDTEDYTNVVVRIHPEFLKEDVEAMQNNTNSTTIENSSNYQRKVEKLPEKSGNTTRETVKEEIIRLMKEYIQR